MLNTTEPFAAAQRAHVELLRSLTAKTLDHAERLASLTLKTAKGSLDDVADDSLTALSSGDARRVWAVPSALLQPAAKRTGAYGSQVVDLIAGVKAEIDRVTAAQTAAAQATLKSAFLAAGAGLQSLATPAAPPQKLPAPKARRS
jgi:phasin family protein